MRSFFELDANIQAEEIMKLIQKQRSMRKPLVSENNQDPFMDLYWKGKEVTDNNNPIPVPPNVPFRFIKRIIGKLIRPYTTRQVHFNQSTSAYLDLVLLQFRKMNNQINELENKLQLSQQELASSETSQSELEREVGALIKQLRNHNDELKNAESNKENANKRIEGLDNWLHGLDTSHKNLYQWVELLSNRLERTEQYQERVRKELFAELKYSGVNTSRKVEIQSKIINKQKYNDMLNKQILKVNLGSGTLIADDYINVDMREIEGVDVIADARELPFPEKSVSELFLSHIIEHFSEQEMREHILPHWYSVINQGGKIKVICPNWEAMLKGYAEGEISYQILKEVTFGSQEYEGNFHFNMFTPQTLQQLLEDIGFKNVRIIAASRKNGMCYEMDVEGERAE